MIIETKVSAVKPEKNIEANQEARQKIQAEFAKLGVECPPEILDHLMVLEENSDFDIDTARMQQENAENILKALEGTEAFKLTSEQKRELMLAACVSDIGKSSPSKNPDCQLAVAKLFSIHNIEDPNQPIEKTLQDFFPTAEERNAIVQGLSQIGITPDMTMRYFWDRHAFWTKEILERHLEIFNETTRIIAASHHIVQGINPYNFNENKISPDTRENGNSFRLKYRIYVLMAIDKYQANVFRSGATHEEAMKYLRNVFEGKYKNDSIMNSILQTMDNLGKSNSLFSKIKKES